MGHVEVPVEFRLPTDRLDAGLTGKAEAGISAGFLSGAQKNIADEDLKAGGAGQDRCSTKSVKGLAMQGRQ
jgi:hypothetical protein